MSKGNERSGAFRANPSRSSLAQTEAGILYSKTQIVSYEMALAQAAGVNFLYNFALFQRVADQEKPLSYRDARRIARTEAAALTLEQPGIAVVMSEGLPAYRLARTLELTGTMERGKRVLMIGSGKTLPELFALYGEPPSEKAVRQLLTFGSDIELGLRYAEADTNINSSFPPIMRPQFTEGKATAVELDPYFHSECLKAYKRLLTWPDELLDFVPLSIGESLRQNRIQGPYDTIWWHRADPQILALATGKPRRPNELPQISDHGVETNLSPILDHLAEGGTFVFTVGTGNNKPQLEYRLNAVKVVARVLDRKLGFKRDLNLPLSIENRDEKGFFAGIDGIVGGLAAKRRTTTD
jgi:hypothetical protein